MTVVHNLPSTSLRGAVNRQLDIINRKHVALRRNKYFKQRALNRDRKRSPEHQAAYDAVVEFNKRHGITPKRQSKLFWNRGKRSTTAKVTLPTLQFTKEPAMPDKRTLREEAEERAATAVRDAVRILEAGMAELNHVPAPRQYQRAISPRQVIDAIVLLKQRCGVQF
jgi:hypothetical protein